MEVEGPAAGEEGPQIGGALLLGAYPFEIGAGLEREGEGSAERADGFGSDVFAETGPLERNGAGFGERRRNDGDERGHQSMLSLTDELIESRRL